MFCEFIASHPSTFFDIAVVCMHINTRGLETRHLPCVSLIIKDIRLKCYVLEQNDPFFFFLWFYVKCCWTTHWLIPTSQRNDLKYRYKNFFFFFFFVFKRLESFQNIRRFWSQFPWRNRAHPFCATTCYTALFPLWIRSFVLEFILRL